MIHELKKNKLHSIEQSLHYIFKLIFFKTANQPKPESGLMDKADFLFCH